VFGAEKENLTPKETSVRRAGGGGGQREEKVLRERGKRKKMGRGERRFEAGSHAIGPLTFGRNAAGGKVKSTMSGGILLDNAGRRGKSYEGETSSGEGGLGYD